MLPKRLLGCRLRHHSHGTEQRARMTHHSGLRYGHCRNVRQSGVWSDAATRSKARSAGYIILCQYVRDQECITWSQFGLQSHRQNQH